MSKSNIQYWLRLRSRTTVKEGASVHWATGSCHRTLGFGNWWNQIRSWTRGEEAAKPLQMFLASVVGKLWRALPPPVHTHVELGPYNTAYIHVSVQTPQHSPPSAFLYLPPYSPFLSPIEEFFSAWRWKVYDRQPLGRGMWWNRCGHHSGMDETLKAILPSISGQGRYCPWCGRDAVARPSCAVRCCLIIFLTANISAHLNNLKNVLHVKLFQWYGKAKYRWRGFSSCRGFDQNLAMWMRCEWAALLGGYDSQGVQSLLSLMLQNGWL